MRQKPCLSVSTNAWGQRRYCVDPKGHVWPHDYRYSIREAYVMCDLKPVNDGNRMYMEWRLK